ncbi:MAG: hypothetical protein Q9216_004998 [Gyalolechia sp. 2 TL-2023]
MCFSSAERMLSPPASSSDSVHQSCGNLPHAEPPCRPNDLDFGSPIDPAWSLCSDDMSAIDSLFDLENYDRIPATPETQYPLQHVLSPESFENTPVSAAKLPVLHNTAEMGIGNMPRDGDQFTDYEKSCTTPSGMQAKRPCRDGWPPKEASFDLVSSSPQPSTMSGGTEDSLFMYYLDHVFYIQLPFYHSPNSKGRGWLFSILRTVKSAYYAALALSERYLLSMPSQNNGFGPKISSTCTQGGYYDLAVKETQILINEPYTSDRRGCLTRCLGVLTSLLQILFCELFTGGREKWQTHLRSASSFIPTLLEARTHLKMLDMTIPNHASDEPHEINPHPEGDCAINVLLGSFISFDIISSASTRSPPILKMNHLHILNTLEISLESVSGCRTSIMALIFEISSLDEWKKEAQRAHKLSIVDLAKRGGQIHERLRQEVAAIDGPPSIGLSHYNPSEIARTATHPQISRIFALAAITYLHVVISGAYAELPEISDSVSETVLAFKCLKDPRQIRNIVWPFCISGCLAPESQYDFFRNLIARAEVTQWGTGTCFEALQIVEECWRARAVEGGNCDWAAAMRRRGCCVLLG